jgi:hypothetical protein
VAENIKWNIPRFRAAAVLKAPLTAEPDGTFKLTLRRGHRRALKEIPDNSTLQLFQRPLGSHPKGSVLLTLVSRSGDAFFVSSTGAPLKPGDWPGTDTVGRRFGSLVVAPVLDGTKVKTLVHEKIAQKIVQHQVPLNRNPGEDCEKVNHRIQHLWLISPAELRQMGFDNPLLVVGLYDGGQREFCGVFHPTGFCMMRARLALKQTKHPLVIPFCQVCRTLLVATINPLRHAQLDSIYERVYP